MLLSTNAQGVITGFTLAPTSVKDQTLVQDFFAFHHTPHPRLPILGEACPGLVCSRQRLWGREAAQRWRDCYRAWVISPPQRNSKNPWPKSLRRWLAGIRQIAETVFHKLHHAFGLNRERPHQLAGFQTRLAAKVALHNFCIWLNRQRGYPFLAFVELLGW